MIYRRTQIIAAWRQVLLGALFFGALTQLLAAALCGTCCAKPPNVVLILTDNQGYFELGCKGNPYLQTPNIDAFARSSVDFCNFHAENFCSPSRAALLTGRQPMRSGVHDTIGGVSLLSANEVTIADRLRKAGYRTGIFGKWHLGMSYPHHPRYRGFDEVFIHGGGGIGQLEDYAGNNHMDAHYEHNGIWEPSSGFSTDVLFDRAADFIESCGERPFFCYIPTPAVHFPVQAEPKALARIKERGISNEQVSLSLLSMIENIDENFGRLLAKLEQLGRRENTLVIYMADQGVGDQGSPAPLWAGKDQQADLGNASEGKHRVFCMMQQPGVTVAGENQALVTIRDVCPTILEVCDVELPDALDGRSLTPLLRGEAGWQDDRIVVMQCPRSRQRTKWKHAAVKCNDWRLVNGSRLYEIAHDSQQQHDVASEHPDVVARLTKAYEEFWNSLPPEEELINRHVLGARQSPHTTLCAMDWYRGDAPWTQGALKNDRNQGVWVVHVAQDGRYRFALRRTRKETPRPIKAVSARVTVGDSEATAQLIPSDTVAELELDLKHGDYDLQTSFFSSIESPQPWGANFVDVELITKTARTVSDPPLSRFE